MSKIIKRGKLTGPAALETFTPPILHADLPVKSDRSLQFITNIREKIGEWNSKFSIDRINRKQQVAQQVETAYNEGYERGVEDGSNREKADHIAAIDALLQEAKRKQKHAVGNMEVKVVELAIYIAERLIGSSIKADPEIVTNIIREVMTNIISGESLILKVAEEDLPLVNARYDQWLGMAGNAREFRIEADRRLRRGDCMVETEGGVIDAVMANRLDCLVEALLKR